jgi:2-polyprenyl-6-hydroxyphenyl methylase/3-demethylubiquinone-9 3-methyltransferase
MSIAPTMNPPTSSADTLDPREVERFAALARDWWDPNGKFRPLHQLGPARMSFVRDRTLAHFGRQGTKAARGLKPLAGLTMLDVGCGGGLVSEPLARMGATVTGIEPAEANIAAARTHAVDAGLVVDYRAVRAEDLAAEGRQYDVVVCLEVLEHVPDVRGFIDVLERLVRPGGLLILSTLNRTLKAYMLAIIGAEYVLRWLPAGTHQWDRFIMPDELAAHLAVAGLGTPEFAGLVYNPFTAEWSLSERDLDVNYLASAAKPDVA